MTIPAWRDAARLLGRLQPRGPPGSAEALFARPERVARLLTAIEEKSVLAGQLEPVRLEQLREYPDAGLRQRAARSWPVWSPPTARRWSTTTGRAQHPGRPARGKLVFKKNCATCHRLENEGVEVGPDLLSALRNKTPGPC